MRRLLSQAGRSRAALRGNRASVAASAHRHDRRTTGRPLTAACRGCASSKSTTAFAPHQFKLSHKAEVPMDTAGETVKFYFDFKSPFTYLALEPALALERSHRISLRFLPRDFEPRMAYGGELEQRQPDDWNKVRYLYADARRFANERGLIIRGPQKLFDSRLANLSGLYADRHERFREYAPRVFERFFKRELDLEDPAALAIVLRECGLDADDFSRYA